MVDNRKTSKYWNTMADILDGQFPKKQCKERGQAMVMLSYIEMMLQGVEFGEDGHPLKKLKLFEGVIREKLGKMGIKFSKCKSCEKDILFLPTKKGSMMPVCLDLTSHFADCPKAKEFRKG